MITGPQTQAEDVREWDIYAGEWVTRKVTVQAAGQPARPRTRTRKTARRRHGAPVDRTGLSDGFPLERYWCDTAYSQDGPLADMREWVKPDMMKPHRPAVVMPTKDMGAITDTSRRR